MTEKDAALVEYLWKNTKAGKLKWENTAEPGELLVALRGKYTAAVRFNERGPNKLTLRDSDGEPILRLDAEDDERIEDLYGLALRNARNVDAVIDDILGSDPEPAPEPKPKLGPITDEDIPF